MHSRSQPTRLFAADLPLARWANAPILDWARDQSDLIRTTLYILQDIADVPRLPFRGTCEIATRVVALAYASAVEHGRT